MSLPNLPGGVSLVWALVYLAVGFYVIPMLLSLVAGKRSAKAAESSGK